MLIIVYYIQMSMIEADAALIPSSRAYEFYGDICRPVVERWGGYEAYDLEKLRPLDGKAQALAPNHRSNWDTIVVGLMMLDLPEHTQNAELGPLQSRAIHYFGKETLWRVPILKQIVNSGGAVKLVRGENRGLEEHHFDHLGHLIKNDAAIGYYPQGHRERTAEDEESLAFNKFKTSLAVICLTYGLPLVPIATYGPVKGPKFPRSVIIGDAIYPDKRSDDPRSSAFVRAKKELMAEYYARLNPLYQEVRELHLEKFPETGWLQAIMRFSGLESAHGLKV